MDMMDILGASHLPKRMKETKCIMSTDNYNDIIHLPHHVSKSRPQMPMSDRAAQFSPFAALTGYEAAIAETARLTDRKVDLSEDEQAALDLKIQRIRELLSIRPTVTVTFFQADARKEGGAYLTHTGQIKRINDIDRVIQMADGVDIPLDDVFQLEGAGISDGSE